MTVLDDVGWAPRRGDLYLVVSESGSECLVDTRLGSCVCADSQYCGVECKHQRRIAYAIGKREVPEYAIGIVDEQLGLQIDDGGRPMPDSLEVTYEDASGTTRRVRFESRSPAGMWRITEVWTGCQ